MIREEELKQEHRNISAETIDKTFPWAYFDGLAQQVGCGGGVVL